MPGEQRISSKSKHQLHLDLFAAVAKHSRPRQISGLPGHQWPRTRPAEALRSGWRGSMQLRPWFKSLRSAAGEIGLSSGQ